MPTVRVGRMDFLIQFAWQPTPPSVRLARKAEAEAAAPDPAPEGEGAADSTDGAE